MLSCAIKNISLTSPIEKVTFADNRIDFLIPTHNFDINY